jgi:hypothetical protein
LKYWLLLRGTELVPARADFDPISVAPILKYIWICSKEEGNGRFRFRLAGEEIRSLIGKRLAGAYVDELFPSKADQLNEQLEAVVGLPALHYVNGPLYRGEGYPIHSERLALPLRERDTIRTVLGVTVFSWPKEGARTGAKLETHIAPTIIPVSELSTSAVSSLLSD